MQLGLSSFGFLFKPFKAKKRGKKKKNSFFKGLYFLHRRRAKSAVFFFFTRVTKNMENQSKHCFLLYFKQHQ